MAVRIKGADFSLWDGGVHHDKTLDWSAYTWDFTYIKVGERLYIDPLFRLQWNASRGYAIRGAYHFFRPDTDPKQAASNTIEYLNGDLGELPLALDLEVTDGRSDTLERAKSYLAWYEQWTGIRPIIYSSPNFLNNVLKTGSKATWLVNYKLFLAQYPFDDMSPDIARDAQIKRILTEQLMLANPVPPAPFKKVAFHQWTARGKPEDVPGYYTGDGHKLAVDLIFYTGTLLEFLDEFRINALPEIAPPPQPTGETMQGTIKTFTNMRAAADKTSADLGDLLTGDVVTFNLPTQTGPDGLEWVVVTDATRNGVPVKRTDGLTVSQSHVWAWVANIQLSDTPAPTPTVANFTLNVDGFKPYSGQLEKQ